MSFSTFKQRAHNLEAEASQSGDERTAAMARVLHALANDLEKEMRDIRHQLQQMHQDIRNLR